MSIHQPPAAPEHTWEPAASQPSPTLLPGLLLVAGIAGVASLVGGAVPVVGAPVVAIAIGMTISMLRPPSERFRPGLSFAAKRVLQGSIVVLGFGLSLHQVLSTGTRSLPVLLGTLAVALGVAYGAGRALGLRTDLTVLIGIGTAICGASAIAAADGVIDADDADVSYAIATIFTFNVIAVLAYPSLGHALGLSQHSFGLWAGTAINDVSSVVAASTVYGHAAASYAVVVKLTRSLAIVPICLALAAWRGRRGTTGVPAPRFDIRRVFPMFILGFVVAVCVNSAGLIPAQWHQGLADVATWMITAALAAIGLSTDLGSIRRAGSRPLLLGAVLWATVGLTSLGLQAATGTI
jgi:uncharacterized integral membrane protein (TIGR00698 family)